MAYFSNLEKKIDNNNKPKLPSSKVLAIVFTIIAVAVPSSNVVQEMAVASVVTYENVEAVKGEATELIDYIIDSVDKLNDSKECE